MINQHLSRARAWSPFCDRFEQHYISGLSLINCNYNSSMGGRFALWCCMLLLASCASNIPIEIREIVAGEDVSLGAVRADVKRYVGHKVRWGGTIASVQNRDDGTWIEIVDRELGGYGRPLDTNQSAGRFLARFNGYLDASIYKVDRPLTIFGVVEGQVSGFIGDYAYNFPLVSAASHYLWREYDPYADYRYRDPYWYYPYWYYPYGYYPYYYSPYRFNFGFNYRHYPNYYFGLHYYPW